MKRQLFHWMIDRNIWNLQLNPMIKWSMKKVIFWIKSKWYDNTYSVSERSTGTIIWDRIAEDIICLIKAVGILNEDFGPIKLRVKWLGRILKYGQQATRYWSFHLIWNPIQRTITSKIENRNKTIWISWIGRRIYWKIWFMGHENHIGCLCR
mgnify:CR=1 FL=1